MSTVLSTARIRRARSDVDEKDAEPSERKKKLRLTGSITKCITRYPGTCRHGSFGVTVTYQFRAVSGCKAIIGYPEVPGRRS